MAEIGSAARASDQHAGAEDSELLLDELLRVAREAAEAGAAVALEWSSRRARLVVEEKGSYRDFVSQADRDSEQAIREVLGARRPGDGVLGEEAGASAGASGLRWVVDPIDGTTEFLYGRASWSVSVAVIREVDGQVLAGAVSEPALGRLTAARRGGGTHTDGQPNRVRPTRELQQALIEFNLGAGAQRELGGRLMDALVSRVRDLRDGGSAAAALAAVAGGRLDAYWGPGLQLWDGAAGVLLVQEAGGVTGDLDGDLPGVWPQSNDVLAGHPALLGELRQVLRHVYSA